MFGSNKAAHSVKLVKDANGAPAVNLSEVREAGHVGLAKKADKAGISLNKRGLAGIRAQGDVTLDNYQGGVDREIVKKYHMGTTDLAGGLRVVLEMANTTDAPIFCTVVTDGDPDSKSGATNVVVELSRYPVFIKFLALEEIEYLRKLDNQLGGKSLIDNVNTKFSGHPVNLLTCTDLEFADAMVDEWDMWVTAAKAKGILS